MIEIMGTKFQRHNSEIRRFYANIFAFINAIHLVASFAFVLNVFRNAWILVKLLLFPKTPTISNCLCIFIVKPMLFCYLIECVRCFTMCMFLAIINFQLNDSWLWWWWWWCCCCWFWCSCWYWRCNWRRKRVLASYKSWTLKTTNRKTAGKENQAWIKCIKEENEQRWCDVVS